MKYGGDGTEVRVEVRAIAPGGARLRVDDNGPGVKPGEREQIWRPFERGAAAHARAAGGSGIGLTIVREIAAEHGGRAWVESTPGGGASFIVDLPDESGTIKRVLVVEDQRDLASLLGHKPRHEGLDVRTVEGRREALPTVRPWQAGPGDSRPDAAGDDGFRSCVASR